MNEKLDMEARLKMALTIIQNCLMLLGKTGKSADQKSPAKTKRPIKIKHFRSKIDHFVECQSVKFLNKHIAQIVGMSTVSFSQYINGTANRAAELLPAYYVGRFLELFGIERNKPEVFVEYEIETFKKLVNVPKYDVDSETGVITKQGS